MWRQLSTAIAHLREFLWCRRVRLLRISIPWVLLLFPLSSAATDDWMIYRNCSLVTNEFYDGDSFHIHTGRRYYIIRLYFVDCPETEDSFPDRLREQADYWGIGTDSAMRLGRESREFTRRFLSKPFTVYTKKEDAMGQSARPRYFGMVRTDQGFLCEALVRHGLARIYGKRTDLPDGIQGRTHAAKLRSLEKLAKQEALGGWRHLREADRSAHAPDATIQKR